MLSALINKSMFSDSMDCSHPGSSVPGTSQARTLEWVAISFSRDGTRVSCTGKPFFTTEPTRKPYINSHTQNYFNSAEHLDVPQSSPWGRRVGQDVATEQQQNSQPTSCCWAFYFGLLCYYKQVWTTQTSLEGHRNVFNSS